MTKLVVEDEQTRVANALPSSARDLDLVPGAPASGIHPLGGESRADRYALAIDALVTTPGGKICACRVVSLSARGLLADGPRGKESALRLGMVCRVRLRRKMREVELDAEIVRVDPPGPTRRPCFAFRISFLTREAQAGLVRLLEEANASSGASHPSNALSPFLGSAVKVGVGFLLATAVGVLGFNFAHASRAMPVVTTPLVRGPIADMVISRSGEIVAEHRTIVRSPLIVPTVMKLSVHRGDRVTVGTVLAEPAGDAARTALTGARNRLLLAQSRSVHATQVADEQQSQVPAESDTAGREKIQRAQDAAHHAREAVVAAQAERDARASDLEKSQIIAPFDGVVVDLKMQSGDLIAPSAPICDLLDDTALRVNAQFDEADVGRIKLRMPVQVAVTGNQDLIRGTVDRIGEIVVADAKVHNVLVEIVLLDRPPLRPGTTARTEILLATKPEVLMVPRSALGGTEGKRTAFVIGKDNELELREVRVGIVASDVAEVLGGLPEGSIIVVDASAPGLANGLLVRPMPK
jgi:RND family efflux transporter MFP subunit